MHHTPVLLAEALEILDPKKEDRVLDVTLGLGGHAEEFLQKIGEKGFLIGLDADSANLADATKNLSGYQSQMLLIHTNFSALPECLPPEKREFDIILADLGLSSPHVDDPARGFSFRSEAPLDMRFDRSSGMTGAMLLASTDREQLKKMFEEFGEVPRAHVLTDAIIAARAESPVRTTSDLKKVAVSVYGYKADSLLPQIFQALRMAVNGELRSLETLLDAAPALLAPGGRLGIISFQSLEDRMVKQTFKRLTDPVKDPVTGAVTQESRFELLTRKPITPGEGEIKKNPRSRSACLRAIRKSPVYSPHP